MSRQVRQLARLAQELLQLQNAPLQAQLVLSLRGPGLLAQNSDAHSEAQRVLAVDIGHLIKRHGTLSSPNMYSNGLSSSRANGTKQSAHTVCPFRHHARSPGNISCAQSEQTARGDAAERAARRLFF